MEAPVVTSASPVVVEPFAPADRDEAIALFDVWLRTFVASGGWEGSRARFTQKLDERTLVVRRDGKLAGIATAERAPAAQEMSERLAFMAGSLLQVAHGQRTRPLVTPLGDRADWPWFMPGALLITRVVVDPLATDGRAIARALIQAHRDEAQRQGDRAVFAEHPPESMVAKVLWELGFERVLRVHGPSGRAFREVSGLRMGTASDQPLAFPGGVDVQARRRLRRVGIVVLGALAVLVVATYTAQLSGLPRWGPVAAVVLVAWVGLIESERSSIHRATPPTQ